MGGDRPGSVLRSIIEEFAQRARQLLRQLEEVPLVQSKSIRLGILSHDESVGVFWFLEGILVEELRILLAIERNIFQFPKDHRWDNAIAVGRSMDKEYGVAMNRQYRSQSLLRSRINSRSPGVIVKLQDDDPAARAETISKALTLVALPRRLYDAKFELLSVRIPPQVPPVETGEANTVYPIQGSYLLLRAVR